MPVCFDWGKASWRTASHRTLKSSTNPTCSRLCLTTSPSATSNTAKAAGLGIKSDFQTSSVLWLIPEEGSFSCVQIWFGSKDLKFCLLYAINFSLKFSTVNCCEISSPWSCNLSRTSSCLAHGNIINIMFPSVTERCQGLKIEFYSFQFYFSSRSEFVFV